MQVARGEVCVTHGHLDVGVAQEFLDRLQASSPHDQVGGEGVAEVVESEIRNPKFNSLSIFVVL